MAFDPVFKQEFDSGTVGSPLKRARASLSGVDEGSLQQRLGLGLSGLVAADAAAPTEEKKGIKKEEEDEEL